MKKLWGWNDAEGVFKKGENFFIQNSYPEAERYLRRVVGLDPNNPSYNFSLGKYFCSQERFVEGELFLRRALELEPNCAKNYNIVGWCLYSQGRLTEAEQFFRKAVELEPNNFLYRLWFYAPRFRPLISFGIAFAFFTF